MECVTFLVYFEIGTKLSADGKSILNIVLTRKKHWKYLIGNYLL